MVKELFILIYHSKFDTSSAKEKKKKKTKPFFEAKALLQNQKAGFYPR